MNAIAERFIGSIRREALDHFLIINRNQLKAILAEYIEYYNTKALNSMFRRIIHHKKKEKYSNNEF
jgi:hypothetical protein